MPEHNDSKVILVVSSNPAKTPLTAANQEYRAILSQIRKSTYRDNVVVKLAAAASGVDLFDGILQDNPSVLHFVGHCTKDGQLIMQKEWGEPQPMKRSVLSEIVGRTWPNLRLVVLNACFSAGVADDLAMIECVVGLHDRISNRHATHFSEGLYFSLCNGRSVGEAVEDAKARMLASHDISSMDEINVAVKTREDTDASSFFIFGPRASGHASPKSSRAINVRKLREALDSLFSIDELQLLCDDVQSDLEIAGIANCKVSLEHAGGAGGKAAKILQLIQYLERRGYLHYLFLAVQRVRPGSM